MLIKFTEINTIFLMQILDIVFCFVLVFFFHLIFCFLGSGIYFG